MSWACVGACACLCRWTCTWVGAYFPPVNILLMGMFDCSCLAAVCCMTLLLSCFSHARTKLTDPSEDTLWPETFDMCHVSWGESDTKSGHYRLMVKKHRSKRHLHVALVGRWGLPFPLWYSSDSDSENRNQRKQGLVPPLMMSCPLRC